jgi:nitrate/nitrite transport system substrate-binding protein
VVKHAQAKASRGPKVGARLTGSDAPEKPVVRVGFMPLSDCASVVMASVLGFDERQGVRIVPTRESSWAGVRDKLLTGELDFAHALYGLVYGMHLGLCGAARPMAVLMTINQNGQGITLSRRLAEQGVVDAESLARRIAIDPRRYTFAQTFPTGTHALWLNYWLASAGIDPLSEVRTLTVPPPQMVAHLREARVDGFSAGEPWNHRAQLEGVGMCAATSQQVWKDHPEKVLGATGDFVARHPNTSRAVTMALLEASRWIDASPANKARAAEVVAGPEYANTCVDALLPRFLGRYDDGRGNSWTDASALKFFDDGAVNYPYLSDGMWFLTQYRRWGWWPRGVGPGISAHAAQPDYRGVAAEINRTALYREAASALGINVPSADVRSSRLIDGQVWDGSAPLHYANSFAIRARSAPALAA